MHHSQKLHSASQLAAEFHCNIDPSARVCQNGDLRVMWKRYAEAIATAFAMQVKYGVQHECYYQAASGVVKVAQALGATMDTLSLPL